MPVLDQDRLEVLAQQPKAAATDGLSATAHDLADVIAVADRAVAQDALDGTNENGGPKSALHCLRPARAAFPGAFR